MFDGRDPAPAGKAPRIVPVHPRAETVHGEPGYPALADIPFDVDVVMDRCPKLEWR